jgi:hypothetical protein
VQVVAEVPYENTDPTVDSQVVILKTSGADVVFLAASPKPAVQAIRKMAELDWKPIRLLASISNSVGAVMKPVGTENAKGILSAAYLKDPSSPLWKDDPAVKEWEVFMAAYYPEGDRTNAFMAYGYLLAQTMAQVLRQCGDNLTGENVMRQAASIKDLELGLLLPGIKINMMLERVSPGSIGFERRLFECPKCDHVETSVIASDPLNSKAQGWLFGELGRAAVTHYVEGGRNGLSSAISSTVSPPI